MLESDHEKLNHLERSIKEAGEKLMCFWPGTHPEQSLEIQTKGDGSPVTKADIASNEILLSTLKELWPQDQILSEEIPRSSRWSQASRVWIIDPLDGTNSFMNGNDDFSILVGLSVAGRMEIGFMYFPARRIFCRAIRGQGCSIDGERSSVSSVRTVRDRALYIRNFEPPPGRYLFDAWMDSGFAFLALSRGEFDGVILKMTTHREWDIAAPLVLVEESGGRVSDEHGNPIQFREQEISFQYVVASNGSVHDQLLQLIKDSK